MRPAMWAFILFTTVGGASPVGMDGRREERMKKAAPSLPSTPGQGSIGRRRPAGRQCCFIQPRRSSQSTRLASHSARRMASGRHDIRWPPLHGRNGVRRLNAHSSTLSVGWSESARAWKPLVSIATSVLAGTAKRVGCGSPSASSSSTSTRSEPRCDRRSALSIAVVLRCSHRARSGVRRCDPAT